jgi:hypothetical protein
MNRKALAELPSFQGKAAFQQLTRTTNDVMTVVEVGHANLLMWSESLSVKGMTSFKSGVGFPELSKLGRNSGESDAAFCDLQPSFRPLCVMQSTADSSVECQPIATHYVSSSCGAEGSTAAGKNAF